VTYQLRITVDPSSRNHHHVALFVVHKSGRIKPVTACRYTSVTQVINSPSVVTLTAELATIGYNRSSVKSQSWAYVAKSTINKTNC